MNQEPDNINAFYSVYRDDENKHEFDIRYFGETVFRGFAVSFYHGNGYFTGGEALSTATTNEDYDAEFFKSILHIKPAYKVLNFLDYHFNKFKIKSNDEGIFIKHIQYVILPKIKPPYYPEYKELIQIWTDKQNTMLLKKQLQQKNEFLMKAYEHACEFLPSKPLSANMNPRELGKSFGFTREETTRIVAELAQDGYASVGAGLRSFMVTKKGLNYLHQLEEVTTNRDSSAVSINVGNNSNVQFQKDTVNSSQNIEVKHSNDEILKFLQELKEGMEELQKHLTPQDIETLNDDIEYLEKNVKKQSPNPTIIKTILQNIGETLKGVPKQVIEGVITHALPRLIEFLPMG